MGEQNQEGISRRKFLGIFVGAVAAAVAAALAVPLIGYFLNPVFAKRGAQTKIAIARASEIPIGVPAFVPYEVAARDGWLTTTTSQGAWIVTQDGKDFVIFDPHCTHLGCLYYWEASKNLFQCPCHGGQFDISGKVLAGPPPRPLDRLAFTIENDTIELITIQT